MTKKKSLTPHDNEFNELQFFALQPLEEAVESIRQLAGNYSVEVEALDADAYQFVIFHGSPTAPNNVFVEGVLRRWEGTFTRLDCKTGFHHEETKLKIEPHDWRWIRYLTFIVGMIIIFLVWLQSMSGIQIFVIEVVPFLLIGIVAACVVYYSARTVPDAHWVAYLEERRALLDALKQQFASAGGLAYSPEDLTENMALALEAEEHLSQGSTS